MRLYERLTRRDGATAILMVSPPRPDGPIIRFGKPYAAIAKLSPDIRAFLAMAEALRALGYSTPRVFASSVEDGLALIEDLGDDLVVENGAPDPGRYAEAVALIGDLHGRDLPEAAPAGEDLYRLPVYDIEAMLIEVELVIDWYAAAVARTTVPSGTRMQFLGVWREILAPILAEPTTWTLRDFHSPNLHWLPERQGLARIGLIDFQDAVIGPPAYDLASLLQDARVDVPDDLEMRLMALYVRRRLWPTPPSTPSASRPPMRHGRPARDQDPRHFRQTRQARRQAAVSQPPAPHRALPAQKPRPSVAPAAGALVSEPPAAGARPEPSRRRLRRAFRNEDDDAPIPKTAMVFAAGLGERMRPITETLPKPLIEVGGRTLIDHCLDRLAADGVETAIVNVHWLADRIEAHLADRESPRIRLSDERDKLLDQGGGIKRALPLIGDEPFLVCNTDAFWIEGPRSNIARLADGFDPETMDIALLVAAAAGAVGVDWPGDFTMTARRRLNRARAAPRRALRLYRRRDPEAGAVRRRARRRLPPRPLFPRRRRQRPSLRRPARRPVAACRPARVDRRGGDGDRPVDPLRAAFRARRNRRALEPHLPAADPA